MGIFERPINNGGLVIMQQIIDSVFNLFKKRKAPLYFDEELLRTFQ